MLPLDEKAASEGLNIHNPDGKRIWSKAKILALQSIAKYENKYLPYWMRVHLIFLEMGGSRRNHGH